MRSAGATLEAARPRLGGERRQVGDLAPCAALPDGFAGSSSSFWATLGLFLLTAPGLYSMVKRSPKSSVKRLTFEEPGPAVESAKSLDELAKQIATYFIKYNYEVESMGEVVTFKGLYEASRGQAFALVFYTFLGLSSISLVLSILQPDVGNWWYVLPLLSPGAYFYHMRNATREETVRVKMVTSDDDLTTDIIVEADKEELDRFSRELGMREKGKVYVKGVLENVGTSA